MKKLKSKRRLKKLESAAEDSALWTRVSETVEPLKNRDVPPGEFDAMLPPPQRDIVQPPAPRPAIPVAQPLPNLSHGAQPGLDKSTAKRLRRGKAQIEARLDLHGMTQDQARRALTDFIERVWYAGKREVLVITGKGTRADGSIGVLRQAVPNWLNDVENRSRVTAFTHAAAKDGGEGALYVRIKKRPLS